MMHLSRFRRTTMVLALAFALALIGVGFAYARHIASYDLIAPRFGAGTAYTYPLTKVNYSRGVDNNRSIAGGRRMYSAIYRGTTTRVTPKILISSGSRVLHSYYSGRNQPGTGYRLGHTNRVTEPYRIQTRGTWSPDQY